MVVAAVGMRFKPGQIEDSVRSPYCSSVLSITLEIISLGNQSSCPVASLNDFLESFKS